MEEICNCAAESCGADVVDAHLFTTDLCQMFNNLDSPIPVSGFQRYLLALCVIILNQVLEKVHSFLSFDLIHFDQVLKSKEKAHGSGCVYKTFFFFLA